LFSISRLLREFSLVLFRTDHSKDDHSRIDLDATFWAFTSKSGTENRGANAKWIGLPCAASSSSSPVCLFSGEAGTVSISTETTLRIRASSTINDCARQRCLKIAPRTAHQDETRLEQLPRRIERYGGIVRPFSNLF